MDYVWALLFEEKEHKVHDGYTKDTMKENTPLCPLCNHCALCAPIF
jgi:hypothetical protein